MDLVVFGSRALVASSHKSTLGLVAMAVTTNMTINFFRKPNGMQNIKAVCKLIKVGKTLVTGEVWLYSVGDDEPVAHVIGTYAIPKQ